MMRDVYAERRAFLMGALDAMGLPYVRPDGAFYVYVDITSTGKRSPEFCLSLLQGHGSDDVPRHDVRQRRRAPRPHVAAGAARPDSRSRAADERGRRAVPARSGGDCRRVARNPDARVVAVTGGAGFVGLNMVTALAEAGHAVVALHQSPLDAVAERVHGGVTTGRSVFVHCDVRDEHALTTVLSEHDVVDVVHAAAITSPAHESTLAMLDVNLRTTQVLLDFAAEQPLRRLVFVSSAGVFRSAESATPLDEAFPVTMEHPYAIFKVAAERLVAFARRERQVDATSVRLGFVYGPYERPTSSRTAMSSVYDAVALARRGEPIVAMAPEVGRDWIHAGDVARGVRMAARSRGTARPALPPGNGAQFHDARDDGDDRRAGTGNGPALDGQCERGERGCVRGATGALPSGSRGRRPISVLLRRFPSRWRARLRRVSGKRRAEISVRG